LSSKVFIKDSNKNVQEESKGNAGQMLSEDDNNSFQDTDVNKI